MDASAASRADQLILQTDHLSLSSPVHVPVTDAPGHVAVAIAMEPDHLSLADDAAAAAQPTEISRHAGRTHAILQLDVCSQHRSLSRPACLEQLPNEILLHVLGFLDVNDLLSTSRASHLLRSLSLAPILHRYRLRRSRRVLPPLLGSPSRPTLAQLISRSIFLTHTTVVSRRLARSLVSIRLSHRLAARPSVETLVERAVLPKECVPGLGSVHIAPGLVAKKRAIEKEKVKDGLRRWIAAKWGLEVREREQGVKQWEESRGIGRVWRLRRFWERVGRGEAHSTR